MDNFNSKWTSTSALDWEKHGDHKLTDESLFILPGKPSGSAKLLTKGKEKSPMHG